jgi:predicted MFS family arabinose efflux permease
VIGAAAVGFGFGLVQNDSLTVLFAAFGSSGYGAASAVWNIAYDAGTGVGALGLGAVAQGFGYPAAFGAAAVLLVVGVVVSWISQVLRSGGREPRPRRGGGRRR